MPQITKIKKQAARERYSIFVDGKYSFACSALFLADSGLREGSEVGAEELERFKSAAEKNKALEKALSYLAIRPRSQDEVLQYLERKGYSKEQTADIVRELVARSLLNDSDFAASWVESRRLLRPRSRLQLVQELRQKGLGTDEIEEALGGHDEEEVLADLVERQKLMVKYPDRQKLMAHLGRKGFTYESIKKVVDRFTKDN